jgi:hypothetical protein
MSESHIGFVGLPHDYSAPMLVPTIPEELPKLYPVRPFYFEDSQVVLQASHIIIMFTSAL